MVDQHPECKIIKIVHNMVFPLLLSSYLWINFCIFVKKERKIEKKRERKIEREKER